LVAAQRSSITAAENGDVAVRLLARQPQHELAKAFALPRLIGFERDANVEIPTDQQDAPFGLLHRLTDEMIIAGGIDDDGRASGTGDAPAILAGDDKRLRNLIILI
jgi:hypothetical protein